MAWTKYTDSTQHPQLTDGEVYKVRTKQGIELYAVFIVYEGGDEVDFRSVARNRSLNVTDIYL